jgi:hypothetical protein
MTERRVFIGKNDRLYHYSFGCVIPVKEYEGESHCMHANVYLCLNGTSSKVGIRWPSAAASLTFAVKMSMTVGEEVLQIVAKAI